MCLMRILYFALMLTLPLVGLTMDGIQVGDTAPNFELSDTNGNKFTLDKQTKITVLVFYRGSWCPYCVSQLKTIETDVINVIDKSKVQLVAISTDKPSVATAMVRKLGFTFPVLSDPKANTMKDYKIANQLSAELVEKYKNSYKIDVEGDSGETHHIVAHPAVFIIKNKKIVFSDVHIDYKKRTDNQKILAALKAL